MKKRYGVKVGLNDHMEGSIAPMTAVALGAEVIEKHFIIDRSIGGPDSAFSMGGEAFRQMVNGIRLVERSLGGIVYPENPATIKGRTYCRSLYVTEDVIAGDVVSEKNVRSVRPGFGLHPKFLDEVMGKYFLRDCQKGERLTWELLGD